MTLTFSGWPKAGDKMRFLGRGGYDNEREAALKVLEVGRILTVESCDVGDWSHSIRFMEIAGNFNGVMFEMADTPPMTQDSQTLTAEQIALDDLAELLGCVDHTTLSDNAMKACKLHGKLSAFIRSLPSPPVSGGAGYSWQESDARIKKLMAQCGTPESMSVYQAMKQLEKEVRLSLSPLTNEPVWLGMTDAPRDGTAILGDVDGSAFVVWWDKMHSGWVSGHTDADDELYTRDVNGWMPLPIPQQEVQP